MGAGEKNGGKKLLKILVSRRQEFFVIFLTRLNIPSGF